MRTIQAVFCDLGNVLVTFKYRPTLLFEMARLVRPWIGKRTFMAELELRGILDQSQKGEDTFWRLDTGVVARGELYAAFPPTPSAADFAGSKSTPARVVTVSRGQNSSSR